MNEPISKWPPESKGRLRRAERIQSKSGIGRELGEYALEHYSEVKTVTMKL